MRVTISTGETKTRQRGAIVPAAKPKRRAKRVTKKEKQEQEMWRAFWRAKDTQGLPFTWREFQRLRFYQWKVTKGDFTDFPGQLQADGAANLHNYSWEAPATPEA